MKFKRNKKNSQKLIATILAIIIVIAMVLSLAAPFFAAETSQIQIETKVGFNQRYRIGYYTPFSIFLKNNGANFNGEVQIKIFQEQYNNANRYSIYSQIIDLPTGSTKTVEFNALMPTFQNTVEVSLVENDNVIAKKSVGCKPIAPEDTMVAVLTDDSDSLNYLKGMKIRNDVTISDSDTVYYRNGVRISSKAETTVGKDLIALTDTLVFIDENSFPDTEKELSNFDALLINNYDTSRLSQNQLDTLNSWINDGGKLILGTGVNEQKVLNGLNSIIDNTEAIDISLKNFDITSDLIDDNSSKYITKGKGKVLIHNFDLGLEPIVNNSEIVDILSNLYLNTIFSSSDFENKIVNNNYDDFYDYHMLKNVPVNDSNLNLKIMLAVTVIYILIIFPILYIILRKKDKLEKSWFIMPIIAVIFTAIVYILSLSTPYKKPILNSVTKIKIKAEQKVANINTSLGILSPEKGNKNIKFNNNVNITSNSDYSNYSPYISSYNPSQSKTVEDIKYKLLMSDKPEIIFYNTNSWNLNTLKLESTKNFDNSIDVDIEFNSSSLKGTVTNNLGYNLENTIIVIGNLVAYCDYIDNNQTKNIDFKYNIDDSYNMLKDIFGEVYNTTHIKRKIDSGEWTKQTATSNLRRYDLLSSNMDILFTNYYNTNVLNESNFGVKIIGFNNDNIVDIDATVNNKAPNKYNENIFEINSNINLAEGKPFYLPEGIINVSDIYSDMPIERYTNNLYLNSANQSVEFKFKIPKVKKLDSFKVFWNISNDIESVQIYNVKSDTWEELNLLEFDQNASDYLDNENNINFKFNTKSSTNITLPTMSIKGEN